MINLKKALLFIAIASISSSTIHGFFPFTKNLVGFRVKENGTTSLLHYWAFPYFLPIKKQSREYGWATTNSATLYLHDAPKSKTHYIKKNIVLWTLGLGATGFAAWYKRDSIATGLEKFATFIKKK